MLAIFQGVQGYGALNRFPAHYILLNCAKIRFYLDTGLLSLKGVFYFLQRGNNTLRLSAFKYSVKAEKPALITCGGHHAYRRLHGCPLFEQQEQGADG
jgi:hypothetical protein